MGGAPKAREKRPGDEVGTYPVESLRETAYKSSPKVQGLQNNETENF